MSKFAQKTLFGEDPKDLLRKFMDKYDQIKFFRYESTADRAMIRKYLLENKEAELKEHSTKMYTEKDNFITTLELMKGKIEVKRIRSFERFMSEYRRASLNRANQFPGMEPYQVWCNSGVRSIPIGLICLSVPLFRNKARDEIVPEDKRQDGLNIQICVSYPWNAKFLTGKLLATICCTMAFRRKVSFVETTSLYGKSIQYDRLPFLRFKGLTNGKGRAGLIFPPTFFTKGKALLNAYGGKKTTEYINKSHSNTKKIILQTLFKESGMWDEGYRAEHLRVRRGYYLCILNPEFVGFKTKWLPPGNIEDAVNYWRNRWLVKRL